MRRAFPFFLLLALAFGSDADAQLARNAVYGEIGGSAVVPSVNYERRFTERWWGRVGFSLAVGSSDVDTDVTFIVPLTASWLSHPTASHHLELGGGVTFAAGERQDFFDFEDNEELSSAFATGIVGYRFQRPGRGFQFRAALTPVVGGGDFLPWAGVSFGYAW